MGEAVLTTTLVTATVALVARIVFDWLKGRRANGSHSCPPEVAVLLQKICSDVEWTRDIHERYDDDGAPLWYVPRSWKDDIGRLARAASEMNTLLNQILEQLRSRPLA